MFELFLTLILIVFPALAIFSFVSTLTTGVYDWSKNQSPPTSYNKPVKSRRTRTKPKTVEFVEYAGHPETFEDSEQFKEILDSNNFDVRDYLKKND